MERAEIERLIRRIGGATLGAAAEALDSELLLPLERQGKIASDICLRMWSDIVLSQLDLPQELGGTKDAGNSCLRLDSILGLTRACATVFARASSKEQHAFIQSWDRIVMRTSSHVLAPFRRSRDWYSWSKAAEATLQIRALAGQTLVHYLRAHPGATPPQSLVHLYEKSALDLPDHLLKRSEGLDVLRKLLSAVETELETLSNSL